MKTGIAICMLLVMLMGSKTQQANAQNKVMLKKEKLEEFRVLFIQNVQLQSGYLSKYKNIDFSIDACSIEIKTVDFEKKMDENRVIFMPTLGAEINDKGEISYKTKAIKEVIENKVSNQITTHFYNSSKDIGLFLKFENQEKYKETQVRIKELAGFCTLE